MKWYVSFILLIVSIICFVFLIVPSLLFTLRKIFEGEYLSYYFFRLAVCVNRLGNVMCEQMFNTLLLKDDWLYPFGTYENVSNTMGKNKQIENLTFIGILLDRFLSFLDMDHTTKSKTYL